MNAPLSGWATFYEITGCSAGALIGLQFVVIALISQTGAPASRREILAFGTPTVVHFAVALVLAGTMSAPWEGLWHLGWLLSAYGLLGIAYSLRVFFHAREATYNPDAEDWFWYTAAPLMAYGGLLAAGFVLRSNARLGMAMVAVISLSFLFVAIRNSWDTVTYIALRQIEKKQS